MKQDSLSLLRRKIDHLDDQILALVSDRARLALETAQEKRKIGQELYSASREAAILERLAQANGGPLPGEAVKAIFREIISACRAIQAQIRVSYLGPAGTFTHLAGLAHFGSSAQLVPQTTISEVFAEVDKGNSHFGVVPVENSTEGSVSHTLDMLVESEAKICGEIIQEVTLDLLSPARRLTGIRKLYSHPQALAQCRHWIEANLPKVQIIETESTALAAQAAARQPGTAAIASSYAGQLYGLSPLRKKIQDKVGNVTRFLVIGKTGAARTGRDKTALLFSLRDEVGALKRVLEPLARGGINLTRIESRPLKSRAWEYLFFLDLEGHREDRKVARALDELKQGCLFVKMLGSYPQA